MDGAGEVVAESGTTGLVESDSVTFCRFGVPLPSVAGSDGGSPGSFASGLGSFLFAAAGRFLFGGGAGGRPSGNTSSGRSALCAQREYSKDLFLGGGGGE